MKPFELYTFIRSITQESYNQTKLPFFLMRAKKALENLHKLGWDDEQIKALIINTSTTLQNRALPLTYQYIVGILCNTTIEPAIRSVEHDTNEYDEWINKEKERLSNVK